jgi:hypothetical protein
MHTADLRGEPLSEIGPEIKKEWLEVLLNGVAKARKVAEELDKAADRLIAEKVDEALAERKEPEPA